MTEGESLLDELPEAAVERLENGDSVDLLVELADPNPLIDSEEPRSMTTLTLQLTSKGVIGDRSLEDEYPEVIGLGDQRTEGEHE